MGSILKILVFSFLVLIAARYFYNQSQEEQIKLPRLPTEIKGNKNSDVMLIFLHGWPNTFRMWDKTIEELKKDNVFIVNVSYPNFAEGVNLEWGMDIIDIAQLVKTTIEEIEKINKKTYKKMAVAHDWGAIFSYLLDHTHPGFIQDLVALDVGPGVEDKLYSKLYAFAYQSYLASNFLLGGSIGRLGTKLMIEKWAKPYGLTKEDSSRIDSSWNYLYYYLWKRIFYYGKILKAYTPSCPVAYIYGSRKPLMFHRDEFLTYLKITKNCEVHEVDEGHWVMNNNLNKLLEVVRRRIKTLVK